MRYWLVAVASVVVTPALSQAENTEAPAPIPASEASPSTAAPAPPTTAALAASGQEDTSPAIESLPTQPEMSINDMLGLASVHAAGNWHAGYTDHNPYGNEASPEGSLDGTDLVVSLSARPVPALSVSGSFMFFTEDEETTFGLNYAFAEWELADFLKLRMGQSKQPFGLYSEVFRVGTLRPFITLPAAVYGTASVVAEFYRGLGLSGIIPIGSLSLAYDVYGGDVDTLESRPWEDALAPAAESARLEPSRNVVGGKLSLLTPVGVTLGGAAYTGESDEPGGERRSVLGGHLEYQGDSLTVRAEVARVREDEQVNAAYVEAAQMLFGGLQLALRAEILDVELGEEQQLQTGGMSDSLLHHREGAVGLNYWQSPSFVIKVSYHYIDGNRFAHPEELSQQAFDGSLRQTTQMLLAGCSFSF